MHDIMTNQEAFVLGGLFYALIDLARALVEAIIRHCIYLLKEKKKGTKKTI